MNNRNVLIVGQPGAGKTQLAMRLAALAPRCVYFDPLMDYSPESAVYVDSGESAIGFLAECWDEPFRLVVRAETDSEFGAVASMVERVQREPGAPPIAVVFEETGLYGGTAWTIPEPVSRIYRLGRRWRISCLAVTQVDSDLHRVYRYCTHLWVALRSQKLSGDFARLFDIESVERLETITPNVDPQAGVHYAVAPATQSLFHEWHTAVTY